MQYNFGFAGASGPNAYRVHEPTSGFGLLAMGLFATESSYCSPSEAYFHSKRANDEKRQAPRLCREASP
jgi:hypothetical protein